MESRLTILILHEGPLTVARCLEKDIVGQGESIDEALFAWVEVFAAQVMLDLEAGREPLSLVPEAPEFYRQLFNRSRRLEPGGMRVPDFIPHPWFQAAMSPELRAY